MKYRNYFHKYIKPSKENNKYVAHLRMTDSPESKKNLNLLTKIIKNKKDKILILTDYKAIKNHLNNHDINIESNFAKDDFLKLCSAKKELYCSNSTFSWWASHFVSEKCKIYMPRELYEKYGYYGKSKVVSYENYPFS